MCLHCGKPFTQKWQKKYCSRSCAAAVNNTREDVHRRKPEGTCKICQTPVASRLKYCNDCRKIIFPGNRGGVKGKSRNRRNYICIAARKIYFQSRPKMCVICGYDKHIQICHIVDVCNFPEGTSYSVINNQANLIGLCPNHHWEFDHDLL